MERRCTYAKIDTRKPMKKFTAVAIKGFYALQRKSGSHWVCQDCHFPACVFCTKIPLHSVVLNSFVSKIEYDKDVNKHSLQPHPAAAEAFSQHTKRYICYECKYPSCQEPGCSNTREPRTRRRYAPWTCESCSQKKCAL